MAIEKSMGNPAGATATPSAYGMNIALPDELIGDTLIEDTDDGGMLINFDPSEQQMAQPDGDFAANLAEVMDEQDLASLASDLIGKFGIDKRSRHDWEDMYEKGTELLGLQIEERTDPWDGGATSRSTS